MVARGKPAANAGRGKPSATAGPRKPAATAARKQPPAPPAAAAPLSVETPQTSPDDATSPQSRFDAAVGEWRGLTTRGRSSHVSTAPSANLRMPSKRYSTWTTSEPTTPNLEHE